MASDRSRERRAMVERQIRRRGVRDERVLGAMNQVPREMFVSADLAEFAYEDNPLPIEAGQTISQPYIVALMIDALRPAPGDRVLEIGAGSGYAAAVLSATTTSTSATATARSAGRRTRRIRGSRSPPGGRRSRGRSSTSSRSAAAW
jgi:protein-L-isoaspartate(D-aspartate) O-methyltransferase